jgi:hypothetical protein
MDPMHVSQPKPQKTSGYLGCPIWVLQPISYNQALSHRHLCGVLHNLVNVL